MKIIREGIRRFGSGVYRLLDGRFCAMDRARIRRTRNIRRIPPASYRRGGKIAYAEWAHVIGIFQTLIYTQIGRGGDRHVLDIGCGTGLLGIASEPFVGEGGSYTGLDVMIKDVEYCRGRYPADTHRFIHFDVANPAYAPGQDRAKAPWPVESGRYDLVTALSVWTHLDEADALFYFAEIARALRPGGKAIVTFFLLDEAYEATVDGRTSKKGRYHSTPQSEWIFDQATYGSDAWRHPSHVKVPEWAIGVTPEGLERMLARADLELVEQHPGNWKEAPGLYFQDVLIFQKRET